MSIKQIEEMCEALRQNSESCKTCRWYEAGLCLANCELAEDNQIVCEALFNAGYRKQEWISVEERLPKTDGDFLVWSDYYGVILGHYFARGRYFISKAVEVTHWMQLPEAPKMKGDEGE